MLDPVTKMKTSFLEMRPWKWTTRKRVARRKRKRKKLKLKVCPIGDPCIYECIIDLRLYRTFIVNLPCSKIGGISVHSGYRIKKHR
jgi:hypothetical protein